MQQRGATSTSNGHFWSTGGLQGGICFTKDLEIFSTFVAAPLPPSPHLFTEVPPGWVSGAGFGVGFRRPALGRFRGGFWCWSGGAFLATRLWLDLGWVGRGGLEVGRVLRWVHGGFWCWSGGAFLATRLWLDLGWVGRGGLEVGRVLRWVHGGFWCWSGGAFLATRLWLDLGWVGRGGLGAGRLRGTLRTHLHGAGSGRGTL